MEKIKMSCPCHFGLESVLKFEIGRIGGEDISAKDGRVSFTGSFRTLTKANLCLSTAERVLIVLSEFKAENPKELIEAADRIPFEDYIGRNDRFPVKGHSLNSSLHSVPACQSIIKKAAVNRLSKKYGITSFNETGALFQIQFSILNDNVTVYLDSSGEGLHKRGYRKNSNDAPIKETLAAGIIDLAHIRKDSIFYDPFCGSGTFLIEAAYKAMNIAPGLKRTFAAEQWGISDPKLWEEERASALAAIKRDNDFFAYGYDIDPEAAALSIENCRKAGIGNRAEVRQADIHDFRYEYENAVTVCNPPYGERLLELKEAENLYNVMGKKFGSTQNHPCFIITPHEQFEQFFGKTADKKRKLYNGMIKCQLYMYYN